MIRGKFYRPADLDAYDRDALAIIIEARGVEVEGSGRNGYVTVEDMREAISRDQDRSGLNPAIVAEPADEQIIEVIVTGGLPVYGYGPGARISLFANAATDALIEGCAVTPSTFSGDAVPLVDASAEPDTFDTGPPTVLAARPDNDEPAGDPSPDNDSDEEN